MNDQEKTIKAFLIDHDGLQCGGCDVPIAHPDQLVLDHQTPKADGGSNALHNRILLCRRCNSRKGARFTITGLREQNKKDGIGPSPLDVKASVKTKRAWYERPNDCPPGIDRRANPAAQGLGGFPDSGGRRRFLIDVCKDLGRDELFVLLVLEQGANIKSGWVTGPRGWNITRKTLADMCRSSRGFVDAAIRSLRKRGYLEVVRNGPTRMGSNFRLLDPGGHVPQQPGFCGRRHPQLPEAGIPRGGPERPYQDGVQLPAAFDARLTEEQSAQARMMWRIPPPGRVIDEDRIYCCEECGREVQYPASLYSDGRCANHTSRPFAE